LRFCGDFSSTTRDANPQPPVRRTPLSHLDLYWAGSGSSATSMAAFSKSGTAGDSPAA